MKIPRIIILSHIKQVGILNEPTFYTLFSFLLPSDLINTRELLMFKHEIIKVILMMTFWEIYSNYFFSFLNIEWEMSYSLKFTYSMKFLETHKFT